MQPKASSSDPSTGRTAFGKTDREGTSTRSSCYVKMQYERVIEQAMRDIQDLLWANLPPAPNLPDDRTVACLRAVVGVPDVQRAIECGNDTALSFVLRGANRILSETEMPAPALIHLLWGIMDERELKRLLGVRQKFRMMSWRKKPPPR